MRIQTTKTTPPASAADRERFRFLVEPKHRLGQVEDMVPVTIGDVLDLVPGDCRLRLMTYSPTTQKLRISSKQCGKRTCPRCCPSYLADRVAGAWALWGGQANLYEDPGDLRLRGDAAEPGIVVTTFRGGRWAFGPGDALRGTELDLELVRLLRALPLEVEVRSARDPNEFWGYMPDGMTTEQIRRCAVTVGVPGNHVHHLPGERWTLSDVSEAQNRAFRQEVWSFRWRLGIVRLPDESAFVDGSYGSVTTVHKDVYTSPELPSTNGGVRHEPADITTVHNTDVTRQELSNSTRDFRTVVTEDDRRPRCSLCDSPDWHGPDHDREYFTGASVAEQMRIVRVHFPWDCRPEAPRHSIDLGPGNPDWWRLATATDQPEPDEWAYEEE